MLRPYEVEKRRLRSLINFKVISKFFAESCLGEFKNQEHKKALKINREMK